MYRPRSRSKQTLSRRDRITLVAVSVPGGVLSVASIIANLYASKTVILEVGGAALLADLAAVAAAIYLWVKQFRLDLEPTR
jgi:hypothetical protein